MTLKDSEFDMILKKMFLMVGVKYTKSKIKSNEWFLKHSWDKKTEDKFKEWLVKFIVKVTKLPSVTCRKYADYFVFNHGWKYKDESTHK